MVSGVAEKPLLIRHRVYFAFVSEEKHTHSHIYGKMKKKKMKTNEKIGVLSILPAHILDAAIHIIYYPNYIT